MTEHDPEEAYFKAREIEQRRALREKLEQAAKDLADKQAIAASVDTDDLALAERIKALGFSGETAKVFDLLPLIHVAWADGSIQKKERATILEVLQVRGIEPGSEAFTMVESLLEERPSDEYREQTLAVLRALLADRADETTGSIVELCERVAGAAGGFLGLGNKVSDEEWQLIERISHDLGDDAKAQLQQELEPSGD